MNMQVNDARDSGPAGSTEPKKNHVYFCSYTCQQKNSNGMGYGNNSVGLSSPITTHEDIEDIQRHLLTLMPHLQKLIILHFQLLRVEDLPPADDKQ